MRPEFDLPHGWAWASLGEVADVRLGKTPSRTSYADSGTIKILKFRDITLAGVVWDNTTRGFVKASVGGDLPPVQASDLLITASAHTSDQIGRKVALILTVPSTFSRVVYVGELLNVRANVPAASAALLHYYFRSEAGYRAIQAHVRGGHLIASEARKILVPIAPKGSVSRLVPRLDEHFTKLDDVVATLERAQRNLTRYRASVLKAAVEGRLVPTEAELARTEKRDYEPASVLLYRILAERRRRWEQAELAKMKAAGKPPNDRWKSKYKEPAAPDTTNLPPLPEGWCWAALDQLLAEPLANGRSVPDGDGFPVLRLTCLRGERVDMTARKTGNWRAAEAAPYLVRRGDFLIARGNGSRRLVGRGCLVCDEPDPVAYPDTLIRVRLAASFHLDLFALLWHGSLIRSHIENRARTTAGIFKINQTDLANTPIPVAPEAEQARLADELRLHLSISDKLTEELQAQLVRCASLRQAILTWAFEGKLVDQDPTDVPAEVLLARIRAEREVAKPAGRAKTQTHRKRRAVKTA